MKTLVCILFTTLVTHAASQAASGISKMVYKGATFSMHRECDLAPRGLSIHFFPEDPECEKQCLLAAVPKEKAPSVKFTALKNELIAHVGKKKYRAILGLSNSFKFQKYDLATEKLDWMFAEAHDEGDLEFASNRRMQGSRCLLVPKRLKGADGEAIVVFDWFAPEMEQAEHLFVRIGSV